MSSVVVLQVSPGTDAGFEAALNGIYSIVDICPALFRQVTTGMSLALEKNVCMAQRFSTVNYF